MAKSNSLSSSNKVIDVVKVLGKPIARSSICPPGYKVNGRSLDVEQDTNANLNEPYDKQQPTTTTTSHFKSVF